MLVYLPTSREIVHPVESFDKRRFRVTASVAVTSEDLAARQNRGASARDKLLHALDRLQNSTLVFGCDRRAHRCGEADHDPEHKESG
jgi:hypothetical protein